MSYYFSKTLKGPFNDVVERATERLQAEGFGILTDIDVAATFKKKLNVEFPKYRILGACNPGFAHQALSAESKVGTMLPCNVIVRDAGNGDVEVAAVDPVASMQAIDNPGLAGIAQQVRDKLRRAIENL